MKWKNLVLLAIFGLLFTSCLKTSNNTSDSNENQFVSEARKFFDNSTVAGSKNTVDYKSHYPRTVRWDRLKVVKGNSGYVLIAPLEYNAPLFIKPDFSSNSIFNLSNLTHLVIYCDSNSRFHFTVLTRIPDSNYLKDPTRTFSGYLFIDDWWGNNLAKYLYEHGGLKKYHESGVQTESIIQICTVIYGYNYSTSDPGGGYAWVESGGCYNLYLPERVDDIGGGLGGSVDPGGGGGSGNSINIVVPPPTNPIANITDYLKCFTNVGGSDHNYSVTVCVQQPIDGSRAAYKWVDGGPIGSSGEGNIANVGHTFLIFSEQYGGTTITRNIGFYPSSGVKPGSSIAPGQLNNDESHSYNISATFSVNNANFAQYKPLLTRYLKIHYS